jgi:ribosomal protein L21E
MKKINSLLGLLLVGGMAVLSSCNKDEANPTLDITSGGTVTGNTTLGQDVAFSVGITATGPDSKLKKFTVTRTDVNNTTTTKPDTSINSDNFTYTYNGKTGQVAGTETYVFTITDDNGNTASKTLTITISGSGVTDYTAKMIGGQNNAAGSFFSTTTGAVYQITDAKNNPTAIDLCYYFGTTVSGENAVIASPDDTEANVYYGASNRPSTWASRNSTRLATTSLTAADFTDVNTLTKLQNNAAPANTATDTRITNLSVNDVIAFKTGAGKLGLFRVSALTATSNGAITIEVKVQQ